VCHPGPTVRYRFQSGGTALAYIPDHEPALGVKRFPQRPEWTSGCEVARDADLLIHDGQYSREDYSDHVGWGHSATDDAARFATLAKVKQVSNPSCIAFVRTRSSAVMTTRSGND
jgi:ribonuclease BN (tRNA processing enzyme)